MEPCQLFYSDISSLWNLYSYFGGGHLKRFIESFPAVSGLNSSKPCSNAIVAAWGSLHVRPQVFGTPDSTQPHPSPAPGNRFPLTPNIFPVTPAAKPSTCLAYCSTCLLFNSVSSRPGSCGSLNNLCHSSSGKGLCFANALLAFSDFRLVCHAVIFICSRASCL